MIAFNPHFVLRQISPPLLRAFLENRNISLPLEEKEINEESTEMLFRALSRLPPTPFYDVMQQLEDIDRMATWRGIQGLIYESLLQEDSLIDVFDGIDHRYDQVMWTYLNKKHIWREAIRFHCEEGPTHPFWYRLYGLPSRPPDLSDKAIARLEAEITSLFLRHKGAARSCRVEHFLQSDRQHYFYAYLSDYAKSYQALDLRRGWVRHSIRRASEIVFAFHPARGTLDVYAEGGASILGLLQRAFAATVLHETVSGVQQTDPYRLEPLKDRRFCFPTDPADRIREVSIKKMRLSLKGNCHKKFTLSVPKEAGPEAIYDSLEHDLNPTAIPLARLRVDRVTFQLVLENPSHGTFTFDVARTSSNLKNRSKRARTLGEKYLEKWGIDVARCA